VTFSLSISSSIIDVMELRIRRILTPVKLENNRLYLVGVISHGLVYRWDICQAQLWPDQPMIQLYWHTDELGYADRVKERWSELRVFELPEDLKVLEQEDMLATA
jgi:hypothetical protein